MYTAILTAAVVPVNWHSTLSNLRVSAGSLELLKYRIRKLKLINENNQNELKSVSFEQVSTNTACDVLHRLRSASDTCWRRLAMERAYFLLTTAQTTSGATAKCHSTTTASVLFPTSSSLSTTTIHVPKMGGFTYVAFTTGSLCLPTQAKIGSKAKQMVCNTVLKHWGVIPSQF